MRWVGDESLAAYRLTDDIKHVMFYSNHLSSLEEIVDQAENNRHQYGRVVTSSEREELFSGMNFARRKEMKYLEKKYWKDFFSFEFFQDENHDWWELILTDMLIRSVETRDVQMTMGSNEIDRMKSKNSRQARIIMLDQTEEYFDLNKEETGKIFYTRICDFLRLEEKDYFGLMFINHDNIKVNIEGEDKKERDDVVF